MRHRAIIAGGREFNDPDLVSSVMLRLFPDRDQIEYIISGTARGADAAGEKWAIANAVPVIRMPAQWVTHGRVAGMIRNAAMAKRGTYLVAFWDGKSRGTKNMIETATRAGLKVHVENYLGCGKLVRT